MNIQELVMRITDVSRGLKGKKVSHCMQPRLIARVISARERNYTIVCSGGATTSDYFLVFLTPGDGDCD